jgi:hypothetical protein
MERRWWWWYNWVYLSLPFLCTLFVTLFLVLYALFLLVLFMHLLFFDSYHLWCQASLLSVGGASTTVPLHDLCGGNGMEDL